MRLYRLAGLLALALTVASPVATAAEAAPLRFDEIRAQQAELRAAALAGTGKFEHMSGATRSEMLSHQQKLLAIIEGKRTPDELGPGEQEAVASALAAIEAAVARAEGERVVCRRERVLGSNRKVRVCKTVAQMEREREAARDSMGSPTRMKLTD